MLWNVDNSWGGIEAKAKALVKERGYEGSFLARASKGNPGDTGTLGHKAFHSFGAKNAKFEQLYHPRFGLIMSIVATSKALIGSVRVGSSYEKLPLTLTQTEPIGSKSLFRVNSSLVWGPKSDKKKAEFGQGYQENKGNWGNRLTHPLRVNFGLVRVRISTH